LPADALHPGDQPLALATAFRLFQPLAESMKLGSATPPLALFLFG
jgi:hypothetical protein